MLGTGGGKSPNLIHKPQNQIREFHPLDRLLPLSLPLPDPTLDHQKLVKSPIADWNSDTSSHLNKVTANEHHRRHCSVQFNILFIKLATPSGED